MVASPRSLTDQSMSAPWLTADRKKFRPIPPEPVDAHPYGHSQVSLSLSV